MRRFSLYGLVIFTVVFAGCARGSITINTAEVSSTIQKVAGEATFTGLKALCKDPEQTKAYQGYMKVAQEVLRTAGIPLIQNRDLSTITVAVANKILAQFEEKLSPELRAAIQFAINTGVIFINLPENPAAQLTEQQRTAILSILLGIDSGITKFLAWTWEGTREMSPPVETPHLTWRRK